MKGSDDATPQLRMISPKELAMLVTLHRQGLGWTQETLAEISGLTVRTVQRVERGEASSIDTRRALARAFRMEDIDAFNKPHAFKSPEQIKREVDEFQQKRMTLAVTVACTGKQLADLTEASNMRCLQQPDNVTADVAQCVSQIFDFMADYGDVDDLYSYAQKLEVHATLDDYLARLKEARLLHLLRPAKDKHPG